VSTLTNDLVSSLYGFAAAEDWPGYWSKNSPELMAWLEEQLAEDHIIVWARTPTARCRRSWPRRKNPPSRYRGRPG
jgi:hypothetical protein